MKIKACISKPQIGRDEKTTLRVREGLEMWLLRYTCWVLAAYQYIRTTQKMRVLFWRDSYLHPWLLSAAPFISCDCQWGASRARCPWDVTHCTEGLHLVPGKAWVAALVTGKMFILDRTNTDSRAGVSTCCPKEHFFISFHESWTSAWGHPGQPTHTQAGRS